MNSKNRSLLSNMQIQILGFLSLLLLTTSCRKTSFESNDKLTKANGLTSFSSALGINSISLSEMEENNEVYSISAKFKVINEVRIDLNKTKLEIEEIGSLVNLSLVLPNSLAYKYKVDKANKKAYRLDKDGQNPIEIPLTSDKEDTMLAITMVLYNDVITNKNVMLVSTGTNRLSEDQNNKAYYQDKAMTNKSFALYDGPVVPAASCEMTIISFRTTRSRSVSNVTSRSDKFVAANPDCKKIFGVDSGCMAGDFFCFSMQTVKCTGGGCAASLPTSPIEDEPMDSLEVPVDSVPLPIVN